MAIATPSSVRQGLTGDLLIDAATTGFRWELDGSRTLDWSISGGFDGEYWTDPASVQSQIEAVLDVFSYYADLKFNFVGVYSTPTSAATAGSELNLSLSTTGEIFSSNNVWGMGIFPNGGYNTLYYAGAPGDFYLNIDSLANTLETYDPGSAGWFLLLHELGHTLGLKHTHDNGGQPGRPTLTDLGLGDFDIDWFSIMSYGDDFNWNLRNFDPATPMILDVLALQYLYGKNLTTNAGDSTYQLDQAGYYVTIWDASGVDVVSAEESDRGWVIYLPDEQLSSLVDTRVGYALPLDELDQSSPNSLFWLAGDIEHAIGSGFGDEIYGSPFDNVIIGLGGDDVIIGWTGDDSILGGGGNDYIDGGEGVDLAYYSGASQDFAWWQTPDSAWRIQDLRSEETDELVDIEVVNFGDRILKIAGATVTEQLGYAFENVLRYTATSSADTTFLNGLASAVTSGRETLADAFGEIVQRADGTTAVAALTYQFFTGVVPSKGGFDYLVSPDGPNPNNLNAAYFQNFSQENRYINFAVNVGGAGEGKAAFAAEYGGLSLRAATAKAYNEIFGSTPNASKLDALLDATFSIGGQTLTRADYFAAYGGDGLEGLGTKAAMVGWLLTEAAKADVGFYARSSNAYLADLADGAQFLVDIVGAYSHPEWAFEG